MTTTIGVRVPLNDLSRAIKHDRDRLMRATEAVLDSGYVVLGPHTVRFEDALANYVGVDYAIGAASGTDALELCMRAVMPEGRRTVMTAANAGGYSSTAAIRAGFAVRYADVDEDTFCLTAESVEEALTGDVGVVVVTHLYGRLTDLTALRRLCDVRGIALIEDCAQALGARLDGRAAGSVGDAAAVSFYPTKNLGAVGDGGAVMTSSSAVAAKVRALRQYGWGRKYEVDHVGGFNSRLDELQAAYLLERLPALDVLNQRRRSIIERYREAAQGGALSVAPAIGSAHVGHLAVAVSEDRARIREQLSAVGVATDVHFPVPDHLQEGFPDTGQRLPITERLANSVLSLPCFPELEEHEIEHVCQAIGGLE